MRGKRYPRGVKRLEARNIPAYAGKTFCSNSGNVFSAEHPRVCGENLERREGDQCNSGTSPRMRGKRGVFPVRAKRARNIPAYAGKTHHS